MARIEVRYGQGAAELGLGIAGFQQQRRMGADYQRAVQDYMAGQEANKIRAQLGQATANSIGGEGIDFGQYMQQAGGLMDRAGPQVGQALLRDIEAARQGEQQEKIRAQLGKAWGALTETAAGFAEDPETAEGYKLLGQAMQQASTNPEADPARYAIALQQFATEQADLTARRKFAERRQKAHDRQMDAAIEAGMSPAALAEKEREFWHEQYGLRFGRGIGGRSGSGSSRTQMTAEDEFQLWRKSRIQEGYAPSREEAAEAWRQIQESRSVMGGQDAGGGLTPAQEGRWRYRDAEAQNPAFMDRPPQPGAPGPQQTVPGGGVPRGTMPAAEAPGPQQPAPGEWRGSPAWRSPAPPPTVPGQQLVPGVGSPPAAPGSLRERMSVRPPVGSGVNRPVPQGPKRQRAASEVARLAAQGITDTRQVVAALARTGVDIEALMADPAFRAEVEALIRGEQ